MTLYDKLPRHVLFQGEKIGIRPEFARVLLCLKISADPVLSDPDKLELCLQILVRHRARIPKNDTDKAALFQAVFDFLADVEKKQSHSMKVFDFEQDAAYIYAAFYQCYHIDLLSKTGRKLHWHQFISLFGGLSEDTRLMQIISIRSRPMPKATKYNADERKALARLKSQYRLKLTEEERKAQLSDGFAKMAAALKSMAQEKR